MTKYRIRIKYGKDDLLIMYIIQRKAFFGWKDCLWFCRENDANRILSQLNKGEYVA